MGLSPVQIVRLSYNRLTAVSAAALAARVNRAALLVLDLGCNPLGSRGVVALASGLVVRPPPPSPSSPPPPGVSCLLLGGSFLCTGLLQFGLTEP